MPSIQLKNNTFSAKDVLLSAVLDLQRAHVESASLDARILLEYVLGVSREQLLMGMDRTLTVEQEAQYRHLIALRAERRPLAQIIGRREFWGADFTVSEYTLDPRPDSETLIEAVLERVADKNAPLKILDLGTGTGCLLLTLLRELPNAQGTGVDICPNAMGVARENARALELETRVEFVASDWCEQLSGAFDIIISNPPYIPTDDIETLAPEVKKFEPLLALDGGKDGLDCYRTITAKLPAHLTPSGFAAFEIGIGQQRSLEMLAEEHGLKVSAVKKDLGGIPRCLILTLTS
ncbi:MAG: peptide chain release factor N(5)-glutamine methyltransferase [Alphaproteobacteria bacterium]|nr:peptide chain release factor N(5)-glutamine methyltransferase [Alphaproteobacteria bacterium]